MKNMSINYFALLVAPLLMFIIGWFWHSPKLLGNKSFNDMGKDQSFLETGNMKLIFGLKW